MADERISVTWVGTDGSVWDVLAGPVRLRMAEATGFAFPGLDWQTSQTAGQHGRTTKGHLFRERRVFWPMHMKDDGATDVAGIQRAWWASVAQGERGTIRVEDGHGGVRSLDVLVQDDGDLGYSMDPHIWSPPFGLTMMADTPFWQGEPLSVELVRSPDKVDAFFGGGRDGWVYEWVGSGLDRYARATDPRTSLSYTNHVGYNARMRDEVWTNWTWDTTNATLVGPSPEGAGTLTDLLVSRPPGSVLFTYQGMANAMVGAAGVVASLEVENLSTTQAVLRLELIDASGNVLAQGSTNYLQGRVSSTLTVSSGNPAVTGVRLTTVRSTSQAARLRTSDLIVSGDVLAPHAFDGDTGRAPRFYILPASATGRGILSNPGDMDAWPVWELRGPLESFQLQVGTATIAGPVSVPPGSTLVIDTNPLAQTVLLDGVNVVRQLTAVGFAPIPRGDQPGVVIILNGQGSVAATVRPAYKRAW